ncbi:MAG: MFS transporter [Chloroflexi bacterium]|nr:MFS transporter [Chloroflexota bacterium]
MLQPHVPEVVRRNFRIDLFGGICSGIYVAVVVGFMPVIIRRMGGSTTDVALVVAAPFIGHLLSPIGIYLLSGLPPVRVVAGVVTTGRVVFLAGVLVATTPLMLGATTVVFWVVNLANVAAYTTVMAAIYPDRERAQAMGKVRMGAAVASLATAAIAGILFDTMSATLVFAAATIISFPGAVGFFWIREEGRAEVPPRRPMSRIAREVWSDLRYRDLLIAHSVFGLGNLMNATVIPLMLVDHFDAPNTFIGLMAALTSAVAVVSYIFWGRLIDRGSSLMLSAYSCALLLAVPLTYLFAPTVWWLLPVAVVTGIVNTGFEITFHTNIVQIAPRGRVLDYATAQSFALGVRGTVAPFLASILIGVFGGSAYPVLFVIITLMVIGTVMYYRAAREFAPTREALVVETAPATS